MLLLLLLLLPASVALPAGCKMNRTSVTCRGAGLALFPRDLGAHVTVMDLSENNITMLLQNSMNMYPELQTLRLSRNRIGLVEPNALNGFPKLQELHLDYNYLHLLPEHFLHGTRLPAIKLVNLSHNDIKTFSPYVGESLSTLERLVLSYNKLETLPALYEFSGLLHLDLSHNSLNRTEHQPLDNQNRLLSLDLSYNKFKVLPERLLYDTTELKTLSLAYNLLNALPEGLLHRQHKLENLSLAYNQFTKFPGQDLVDLPMAYSLDFSGNPIAQLTVKNSFSDAHNNNMYLDRFYMRDMPRLTAVGSHSLSAQTDLTVIVISDNRKLTEVSADAFYGLDTMHELVLRRNSLQTLAQLRIPWEVLYTLRLELNPWICDCRLLWLKNVLLEHPVLNKTDFRCHGPRSLSGRLFSSLSAQQLCTSRSGPRLSLLISLPLSVLLLLLGVGGVLLYRFRERLRCWGGRQENKFDQITFSTNHAIANFNNFNST